MRDVNTALPLCVSDLNYVAGQRQLVRGLNLSLTNDALTMVMGPNGAGKSLLLRLVHGLITPSSGSITWNGQRPGPQTRNQQAMVFQRPVLLRRSVRANLRFAMRQARQRGLQAPDESGLLRSVGLLVHADQAARQLSGGEQQRLALVRALALRPRVLLLDEPTANLDPVSTQIIESLVHDTARQGTKIIWVTHDVAQARRLAGDVVFMDQGTLAAHQPAGEFFSAPASDAACAYLEGRLVIPNLAIQSGDYA